MTLGPVAVTGATGLVGGAFCRALGARGCEVRALVRRTEESPLRELGTPAFRFELEGELDRSALEGARAVVHCAWTTRERDPERARQTSVEGTRRILDAARAAGVERFVLVSTTTAAADSLSAYGRSKHALEGELAPERDLCLRLGLVLSRSGGLFCRLRDSVARARLVPVFGNGRQPLQTVHADDLCAALVRALELGATGTYVVAEPGETTYRSLLEGIARRLGRRVALVPVPFGAGLRLLRALERLPLPLPVTSENLLGLRGLRHVPSEADLRRLGVSLRSAEESLDELLGPPEH